MSLIKLLIESDMWYHGTYDYESFKYNKNKPIFLSKEEYVAKHYAGQGEGFFDSTNDKGKVFNVEVDFNNYKVKELSAEDYMDILYDGDWKDDWKEFGSSYILDIVDPLTEDKNNQLIEKYINEGYDALIIEGDQDATPMVDLDYDQIIIFNHKMITLK